MLITAQYLDPDRTIYSRSDLPGASIPVDLANRHHAGTLRLGIQIADYMAPPLPPPDQVTTLALINAMAAAGWITDMEADMWVARTSLPAAAMTAILALPSAEQARARRCALGSDRCQRLDLVVQALATAAGADDAAIDAVFREAAAR